MLDPASIGRRLVELAAAAETEAGPRPSGTGAEPGNPVNVTARLQHLTGIDVSLYKPATVRRQLQRRMAACQKPTMEEYLQLLEADSSESAALVKGLLVAVTAFFRDPPMFAALAERLRSYVGAMSMNGLGRRACGCGWRAAPRGKRPTPSAC